MSSKLGTHSYEVTSKVSSYLVHSALIDIHFVCKRKNAITMLKILGVTKHNLVDQVTRICAPLT